MCVRLVFVRSSLLVRLSSFYGFELVCGSDAVGLVLVLVVVESLCVDDVVLLCIVWLVGLMVVVLV